jgi:hypothetical protein
MSRRNPIQPPRAEYPERRGYARKTDTFYVIGLWNGHLYSRWIAGLGFSNEPELFIEYQDAVDAADYVEDEVPEVEGCLDILQVSFRPVHLGARTFKEVGR